MSLAGGHLERGYTRYIHFVTRRAGAVLVAGLLLTGLAGWAARGLRVEASFASLLPESFSTVRHLNRFTEQFGGFAFLIVAVETKDLEAAKRFATHLAGRLEKLPEVRYVDYRFPQEFFQKRDLLYLELEDLREVDRRLTRKIAAEKRRANPLYISLEDETAGLDFSDIQQKYDRNKRAGDYIVSPAGDLLLLMVRPAGHSTNVAFARRLIARVREEVEALGPRRYAPDLAVEFTGRFQKQLDEYDILSQDITRTAVWAAVLVWGLLMARYRTPWVLLLMGLPLTAGLVWTLAFAAATFGHLSIVTGFLIAVLLGLGLDYVVHFYNRYLEERETVGPGEAAAVLARMRGQAWAMVSAALTTAAAFYPIAIAEFKGFREFGVIAGTGVLLTLLAFLTLFPALISFAERYRIPLGRRSGARLRWWDHLVTRYPAPVLLGGIGLAFAALAAATGLRFEYDFSKLVSPNIPSYRLEAKAQRVFGLSFNPSVVLATNQREVLAAHEALDTHLRQVGGNTTLDAFASIYSYVPRDQPAKLRIIRQLRSRVEDDALNLLDGSDRQELDRLREKLRGITRTIGPEDVPPAIRRVHEGLPGKGGHFLYLYPNINQSDMRRVVEHAEEIRSLQTRFGPLRVTGESLVFADILAMIHRDGGRVLAAVAVVLGLLAWWSVRRVTTALVVLSPLLIGMAWTLGALAALDLPLNFISMLAFPIVLGIGIDHGIHIYLRFREVGRGGIREAIHEVGPSIALSSLTSGVGFAALLTAQYQGLVAMGQVALLGIGATFLSAVTVYPALLWRTEQGSWRGCCEDMDIQRLLGALDQMERQVLANIPTGTRPAEALERSLATVVEFFAARGAGLRACLADQCFWREELSCALGAERMKRRERQTAFLAGLIRRGIDDGDFRPVDPRLAAVSLQGAMNLLVVEAVGKATPEFWSEVAREAREGLVGGLLRKRTAGG